MIAILLIAKILIDKVQYAKIQGNLTWKKHNSLCFYRVRECVASKILMPFKVKSEFNLADILTKSLPRHKRIFRDI